MRQIQRTLNIESSGIGFYEITEEIALWLRRIAAKNGLLTLFIRHTSASLTIQENADPDVQRDLLEAFDRLAPQNMPYHHRSEGPDDMPAHIKGALTDVSLSIPVSNGEAVLGTWQGIFVVEHRTRPRERQVVLHFQGDAGHEPEFEME